MAGSRVASSLAVLKPAEVEDDDIMEESGMDASHSGSFSHNLSARCSPSALSPIISASPLYPISSLPALFALSFPQDLCSKQLIRAPSRLPRHRAMGAHALFCDVFLLTFWGREDETDAWHAWQWARGRETAGSSIH